ncbi:32852_t:CDS:2, partial [Gigaspora margarita]
MPVDAINMKQLWMGGSGAVMIESSLVQALQNCSAESIATFFLKDIISQHGCPHEILSDQKTHFFNKIMKEISQRTRIKQKLVSTYHLQTNGIIESS